MILEIIRSFFYRKKEFYPFAHSFMRDYAIKNDIKYSTESELRTSERIFPNMKYIKDFTSLNIIALNEILMEKYKQRYVMRFHWFLEKCLKEAVRRGYLQKNPYDSLKLKKKSEEHIDVKYVEPIVVQTLIRTIQPLPLLQFASDLFVFQCHTGLSYADMMSFTSDKIMNINGKKWIVGSRKKTNTKYSVPILKTAGEIIDKYSSITSITPKLHKKSVNYIFPHIGIVYYNRLLNDVCKNANISEHLTSHRGRHTFATEMLTAGVSTESVAKMLGHSRLQMTELYSQVTMGKIDKETSHLFEK